MSWGRKCFEHISRLDIHNITNFKWHEVHLIFTFQWVSWPNDHMILQSCCNLSPIKTCGGWNPLQRYGPMKGSSWLTIDGWCFWLCTQEYITIIYIWYTTWGRRYKGESHHSSLCGEVHEEGHNKYARLIWESWTLWLFVRQTCVMAIFFHSSMTQLEKLPCNKLHW